MPLAQNENSSTDNIGVATCYPLYPELNVHVLPVDLDNASFIYLDGSQGRPRNSEGTFVFYACSINIGPRVRFCTNQCLWDYKFPASSLQNLLTLNLVHHRPGKPSIHRTQKQTFLFNIEWVFEKWHTLLFVYFHIRTKTLDTPRSPHTCYPADWDTHQSLSVFKKLRLAWRFWWWRTWWW